MSSLTLQQGGLTQEVEEGFSQADGQQGDE
jgi:hypothetical protein